MSARERLRHEATQGPLSPERADELIDDVLHEAAEAQRAWAPEDGGAEEYGSHQNVLEAADLIDPKVQQQHEEELIAGRDFDPFPGGHWERCLCKWCHPETS